MVKDRGAWRAAVHGVAKSQSWLSDSTTIILEGSLAVSYKTKCTLTFGYSCGSVAKLCLTLCNLMDFSRLGSSVRGISQAKILEWVVLSLSRGSSRPRDWTCISHIGRWILNHWTTREVLLTCFHNSLPPECKLRKTSTVLSSCSPLNPHFTHGKHSIHIWVNEWMSSKPL